MENLTLKKTSEQKELPLEDESSTPKGMNLVKLRKDFSCAKGYYEADPAGVLIPKSVTLPSTAEIWNADKEAFVAQPKKKD